MPKFGLGYRKDLPHKRMQKDARLLFASAPSISTPASYSLEAFECAILNQGASGSCTGHGSSQGIYTTLNAAGNALSKPPSPGALYKLVRSLERAEQPDFDKNAPLPLTDSGAMPSDMMTVISNWGIEDMKGPTPDGRNSDVWTAEDIEGIPNAPPPNINTEIGLLDIETSRQKLLVGEYRIDERTSDTIALMRSVLALSKSAVGIGAFVDSAVMNWTLSQGPLSSVNLSDPQGGGHWIAITSYDTLSTGKTVFRIANSWGQDYGDAGHFEVTEDWITQAVSDIYALTVRSPS